MTWIHFDGTAQRTPRGWLLTPTEDDASEIEMDIHDVTFSPGAPGRVVVRVGARALRISMSAASPANTRPIQVSPKSCAENRSRCTGGVEFCCSDEIAGKCDGYWNDCRKGGLKITYSNHFQR
jgi:hypothetical protein